MTYHRGRLRRCFGIGRGTLRRNCRGDRQGLFSTRGGPLGNPNLIVATAFDLGTLTPETAYTATSGRLVISKDDVSGLWTIDIENAHLMNLEHPGWMNTTGSLHYVGPLFGLEN